jgi:hypothetical protein
VAVIVFHGVNTSADGLFVPRGYHPLNSQCLDIFIVYKIYLYVIYSSYEELEDTKGVIRIRKSKDRQHNITEILFTKHAHKTKDLVARIALKTEGEPRCSGRVNKFLVH